MVPSAWVEDLREHWNTASETEVEVRIGSRGAWHPLDGSRIAITHVEEADDLSEMHLALTHAQSAYDKGWAFRDKQKKRVDVKLCIYQRIQGKGMVKLHEVKKGGRLDDDAAEDIPDEYGGFSPLSVWKQAEEERGTLIGHINTLIGRSIELSGEVVKMAKETKDASQGRELVMATEIEEAGKAYRTERGLSSLERLFDKFEEPMKNYAEAKRAESLLRTPRPKTGDDVRDAWGLCVDLCTLPAAALIKSRWPDAGKVLVDAWSDGNITTREGIIDIWNRLRPSLTANWQDNVSALPGGLREALIQLVVTVKAAEAADQKEGKVVHGP